MFLLTFLLSCTTLCLIPISAVNNTRPIFPNFTKTSPGIPRIVGGQQCTKGDFPWMASLQLRGSHFCGGTLINDQWVLTAAHCVDNKQYQSGKVVLGEYSLSKNDGTEIQFTMAKVIIHNKWNTKLISDDIALIKLDRKVDFAGKAKHIKALELPKKDLDLRDGYDCVATGWGLTDANSKVLPDLLQKVTLPITNQKVCTKNYEKQIQVRPGNLCAGGQKGKGICNGDSGGPLQCRIDGKWAYVGLDSFTAVCALQDYPSVFTRITYYRDWIDEQLARY